MDVCYAMYKTKFASAYPFTYDLIELAHYYVAWDRLMRHWEDVIGDQWLSLTYEDLVSDQETYTRILISHCGLAWDDKCLQFERNVQPVSTASAVQVRQPLYTESVGRWRAYSGSCGRCSSSLRVMASAAIRFITSMSAPFECAW